MYPFHHQHFHSLIGLTAYSPLTHSFSFTHETSFLSVSLKKNLQLAIRPGPVLLGPIREPCLKLPTWTLEQKRSNTFSKGLSRSLLTSSPCISMRADTWPDPWAWDLYTWPCTHSNSGPKSSSPGDTWSDKKCKVMTMSRNESRESHSLPVFLVLGQELVVRFCQRLGGLCLQRLPQNHGLSIFD